MGEQDRCRGCIFGAWLGDASGAVLEFRGRPSEVDLQRALDLPGGGAHNVGPGQITDDGELTCALLHGLIDGNSVLDLNKIATRYGQWILSKPFDLGGTLRKSLPKACNMKTHQAEMVRRGAKLSNTSQSNGCLMRISPMGIFCRNLPLDEIYIAVSEEVSLSHQNESAVQACCLWVICLCLLIKSGNRIESWQRAKDFIQGKVNAEVADWIRMIDAPSCDLLVHKPAGWLKISFIYGLRYLIQGLNYTESITLIMRQGGDTDTNACIIGSLIAAADGYSTLPLERLQKVINWSPNNGGLKRPKWLRVNTCSHLVDRLIELAPTTLRMVGSTNEYKTKTKQKL